MRKNDRTFRPVDPQLAAPSWVWGLVIVLIGVVGGAAAIFAVVT